jgi:hypothetical protein
MLKSLYAIGLLGVALAGVSVNAVAIAVEAQTTPAPLSAPVPTAETIAQQLQGRWQFRQDNQTVSLIFAPNNQVIFILPDREDSFVAVQMTYELDPTHTPMHLDLIASPEERALTVLAITDDGELHINLNVTPGDPRPTQLEASDVLMTRVTDSTAIPDDIPIVNLESTAQAPPIPIQFITILLQGQQAYFLKNGTFAADLGQLGFATVLETEEYYYEMIRDPDGARSVTIAAMPKTSELLSYAGAVFAPGVEGEANAIAGICQSENPSPSPPIPQLSEQNRREIECPSGASLVQ